MENNKSWYSNCTLENLDALKTGLRHAYDPINSFKYAAWIVDAWTGGDIFSTDLRKRLDEKQKFKFLYRQTEFDYVDSGHKLHLMTREGMVGVFIDDKTYSDLLTTLNVVGERIPLIGTKLISHFNEDTLVDLDTKKRLVTLEFNERLNKGNLSDMIESVGVIGEMSLLKESDVNVGAHIYELKSNGLRFYSSHNLLK
ncbi:hypothetical protein HOK68_03825 [Candidatus Woesearchaeota archaeon]|jgi:hypothetical protein|nr:hypothetical protein [Candidatus Woesearchaeota archaeon]MBT4387793.1 hypothetical protein [Candidatus Woesearchaeota archaeon]MBT4595612.1 hypothetical protein [Candidatus Woesearchaeota archaeon]MBT5740905.1 hypothetical protein [Candidatus Woesearchaeota archaeon]MBT6505878.1 hypothetical protein [Candidatus Woesearchaeota archaeon]